MRVVLITCVYQRHALTAVFWRWTAHLRRWWVGHDFRIVCAGSRDDRHRRMAEHAGAEYLDVPNEPLGRKFNLALAASRVYDPDAVFIMGSDDLFDARTANAFRPHLTNGRYAGVKDFWFWRLRDRQLGYWGGYAAHRTGEPAGGARLLPREAIQAVGWQLWADDKHKGMDHSSFHRLDNAGFRKPPLIDVREIGGITLAIKGRTNLWAYEQVRPGPETDVTVLNRLPADVLDALRALPADV